MNLHEYQSKQLFAQYAIPVPKGPGGGLAAEAVAAAPGSWAVLSGWSRPRCTPAAAARRAASRSPRISTRCARPPQAMLGTTLVTHQTGPEGLPVHQVYVEQGSKIAREIYLSLVLNREVGPDRLRRLGGGRHGHRGGRGAHAGEDHPRQRSSDGRAAGLSMPAAGVRLRVARRRRSRSSGTSRMRSTSCTWNAMPAWSRSTR